LLFLPGVLALAALNRRMHELPKATITMAQRRSS
jgi:hypothetical protein